MRSQNQIIAGYHARAQRFAAERDHLAERSRRISWARTAAFAAALALFVRAELIAESRGAFLLGGVSLLVVFGALVAWHGRVKRMLRRAVALVELNEQGPHRIARDWARLPGADYGRNDPAHAYALDLDLFGRASLFQLVGGVVGTAPGRATLAQWLLAPAPPDEVRARQAAVAELAPMIELREELAVRARLTASPRAGDVERFLDWAEGEPWLLDRPALIWATRLIASANVVLVAADAFGWIDRPFWLITILIGLALTVRTGRRVRGTFDRAFAREGAFRTYAGLLRILTDARLEAPRLRAIQQALTAGGEPAHRRMRDLERIMELADTRRSGMLHLPIHALTLWDFHVLLALERWQRAYGRAARSWLDALGAAEALAGMATLAHDHPRWTYAEIIQQVPPIVEASALGHPLIPPATRVDNDVTVGPPGTVLLVTGSNMSGKSTLLRAIGANAVLAQAGAPACASVLRLSPVSLWTSMRVQDSLSHGVSYFMAELRRLKQVVDAAAEAGRRSSASAAPSHALSPAAAGSGSGTVLYLLDEVLHGTNTAERRIAAQRIIATLVELGSIGVVSTHDLSLAEAAGLRDALQPVHFTEVVQLEEGRMTMSFDYLLKEGVATSTNALKLMEIVGLGLSGHP